MRAQQGFDRIAEGAHSGWFAGAFVALRLAVGFQFFFLGWSKLTTDWSAAGYLASADGPFAEWFHSLAGSGFVDSLNAWGQLLIGLALVLGLAVRPASLAGVLLMALYYFAHFAENTAQGLIEQRVILALIFLVFSAGGAGHVFGLNTVVLSAIRKPRAAIRFLLS